MSRFDDEFRAIHASMLEAHTTGQRADPDPSLDRCWRALDNYVTKLCAHMLTGRSVPESAIALVAHAALALLAASAVERAKTADAVAPAVDRLCNLAGGDPCD